MNSITVSTKSALRQATEKGVDEIIVTGDLAKKLKRAKKIAYVGGTTLTILAGALAAAPFTGGISIIAAAPIAALTGLEISLIIVASTIGLALILAVYKDYEEIEYDNGKLSLLKKR